MMLADRARRLRAGPSFRHLRGRIFEVLSICGDKPDAELSSDIAAHFGAMCCVCWSDASPDTIAEQWDSRPSVAHPWCPPGCDELQHILCFNCQMAFLEFCLKRQIDQKGWSDDQAVVLAFIAWLGHIVSRRSVRLFRGFRTGHDYQSWISRRRANQWMERRKKNKESKGDIDMRAERLHKAIEVLGSSDGFSDKAMDIIHTIFDWVDMGFAASVAEVTFSKSKYARQHRGRAISELAAAGWIEVAPDETITMTPLALKDIYQEADSLKREVLVDPYLRGVRLSRAA